jgi:hypothetical protein
MLEFKRKLLTDHEIELERIDTQKMNQESGEIVFDIVKNHFP